MPIKEYRKAAGMTQVKLAETMGVSQSTVCGWETGAVNPPADALPRLADLFHCTIDALFGREEAKDTA